MVHMHSYAYQLLVKFTNNKIKKGQNLIHGTDMYPILEQQWDVQYFLVPIRKDLWYAGYWTVLVLHVLGDCTIIPPHTYPGMMPLKLHIATHRTKRNDGSIDIIIVLLLLGTCQGWNGLNMRENYQLHTLQYPVRWLSLLVSVCFVFCFSQLMEFTDY